MIQAEFIRDMHNNYLILTGLDENLAGYHIKMLLNNTIPGLLNVELRCIDQMNLFYYDITTLKSITSVCENKLMRYDEMKDILKSILCTLEKIGEYLLSEDDCIINPEYIYVDPITHRVFLCHLIGLQENVQEQLSKFMEYLMNKVDYKDEYAVLLIYAMYKMSREPDCTFHKLKEELNRNLYESSDNVTGKRAGITKEKKELVESNYNEFITNEKNSKSVNNRTHKGKNNNSMPDTKNTNFKKSDIKDNDRDKDNNRDIKKNDKTKKDLKKSPLYSQINSFRKRLLTQVGFTDNRSGVKPKEINKKTHCDKRTGVMPEEIENEYETIYYSVKTYCMAVLSILIGIGFVIGAIQTKLLHNSFGTRIDMVKLACCFIIITMAEVLIMSKLFDEKNQLTRREMKMEYIDPNAEVMREKTEQKDVFGGLLLDEILPKIESPGENIVNETTILWSNADASRIEPTRILAELNQKKYYFENNSTTTAAMEEGTRFYIVEFPFVIGKSEESIHMLVDDPSVSRKHAVVSRAGEDLFITDLKSTNGTYINGKRIEANKPYLLSLNDQVTISKFKFVLREI